MAKWRSVLFILVPALLLAEGLPFSVSGPIAPGEQLGPVISDLKYKAVLNYLQRLLGPRYDQYSRHINNEFAEKYVLDYKVARVGADKSNVEVSGHLDADSLKRWLRVTESKHGSNQIKPLLLISSEIPEFRFSTSETPTKVRDTPLGQFFLSELTPFFQKLGAKLAPSGSLASDAPPKSDDEARRTMERLSSAGNCVFWIHFAPCASCGGARLDVYMFGPESGRKMVARSEEIFLSGDPMQAANTKTFLHTFFTSLKPDIEEAVSGGLLFARPFTLDIEGLNSKKGYKGIEGDLIAADVAIRVTLKKARGQTATLELLTLLSPEEVAQRFQEGIFSGYQLKVAARVDTNHLVVRYSK